MTASFFRIRSVKKGGAGIYVDYIARLKGYSESGDLVASGCGNLPPACNGDPVVFFNAADKYERKNSGAARELVVSLPRELNDQQLIDLVLAMIQIDIGIRPYVYGIHRPHASDGGDQPHVHIMYSDRLPDEFPRELIQYFRRYNASEPQHGGCKKGSGGQQVWQLGDALARRKEQWADEQNRVLASSGHSKRVTYTKKRDQR